MTQRICFYACNKAAIAALFVFSAVGLVACSHHPILWEIKSQSLLLSPVSVGTKANDGHALQRLVERLQTASPVGLPSLRWLKVADGSLDALYTGQQVTLSAPSGERRTLTLKQRQTDAMGVESIIAVADDWRLSLSRKGEASSGTLSVRDQRWKLHLRGNLGIIYRADEARPLKPGDAKLPPEHKSMINN